MVTSHHALETLKGKCLLEEAELWQWPSEEVEIWNRSLKEVPILERAAWNRPLLRMHDHLRDLGREMANELSHPRRLWHPQHLKSLVFSPSSNSLNDI